MNSEAAKYSLDELPGDSWEVRRTKQVVRAILRSKTNRNVTTEKLAEMCSRFLGDESAVKTSTLNGLFAGKRKSISIVEVEMFGSVLFESMFDLLFPVGEQVEVRPGVFVKSPDALVEAFQLQVNLGRSAVFVGTRAESLFRFMRQCSWLEGATVDVIGALRRLGEHSMVGFKIQQLRYSIKDFQDAYRVLEANNDLPSIAPTVSWAIDVYETEAVTPEFLKSIEPLFDGFASGDYWLGRGAQEDEHKETP